MRLSVMIPLQLTNERQLEQRKTHIQHTSPSSLRCSEYYCAGSNDSDTDCSRFSSPRAFLNGMSDELRQHVAWTKRHLRFKKLKHDARNRGPQQQAGQKRRSNSASAPGSRRSSHKSGDDVSTDMLNAFDAVLEEAQGGPVQTATVSTFVYPFLL